MGEAIVVVGIVTLVYGGSCFFLVVFRSRACAALCPGNGKLLKREAP